MFDWQLIKDIFFCIFGWIVIVLLVVGFFIGGDGGVDFAGNVIGNPHP